MRLVRKVAMHICSFSLYDIFGLRRSSCYLILRPVAGWGNFEERCSAISWVLIRSIDKLAVLSS